MTSHDFQFSKVVNAVSKAHSMELMGRVKGNEGLDDLYWRFKSAFHTGLEVFEAVVQSSQGSSLNLCDSLKVRQKAPIP